MASIQNQETTQEGSADVGASKNIHLKQMGKKIPSSSDTNSPASQASLDQVRELLFGVQLQEHESKREALEQRIFSALDESRQQTAAQFDALEMQLKREVAHLRQEFDEQLKHSDMLAQETMTKLDNAVQSIDDINKQSVHAQQLLGERLEQEVDRIGHALENQKLEIVAQVEKASAKLDKNKTDRHQLASLLNQIAAQLDNTESE